MTPYKKIVFSIFLFIALLSSWYVGDCLQENSKSKAFLTKKVVISEHLPFLQAIEEAEGFLCLGAYKLHRHLLPNKDIWAAINKAAENKGLKGNIFLLLEKHLTKEEQKNGKEDVTVGDSFKKYQELGVQLIESSPAFQSTHYKLLVTKKYAFVGTTNFDKDFGNEEWFDVGETLTRDFSLILTDSAIIDELQHVLRNDIQRKQSHLLIYNIKDIEPGASRLTWGPEHHRIHFKQLIEGATRTIEIYQQALQDEEITNLLQEAIKRGVNVYILMSEFPFGPKHGNKSEECQLKLMNTKGVGAQSSCKILLTGQKISNGQSMGKRLHIHAKVMIIDGDDPQKSLMYLGSANFYTPALDKDRNVGLITRNSEYIEPVRAQFQKDWKLHERVAP